MAINLTFLYFYLICDFLWKTPTGFLFTLSLFTTQLRRVLFTENSSGVLQFVNNYFLNFTTLPAQDNTMVVNSFILPTDFPCGKFLFKLAECKNDTHFKNNPTISLLVPLSTGIKKI